MTSGSKAVFGLLLATVLVAAPAAPWAQDERQAKSSPSAPAPLKIYGSFCGPGNPVIEAVSTPEKITALKAIKPYDSLDGYCQRHDICYQVAHPLNADCDKALIRRARALADAHREAGRTAAATMVDPHSYCTTLADMVADYFESFHPSHRAATSVEDFIAWARRIISTPLSVIRKSANRIGFLFANQSMGYRCPRAFMQLGEDGQLRSFVARDGLE